MSNTNNNLEFYKATSIISIGIVVTFIMLILFVPRFSVNFFYEVGTILIYSGNVSDIPNGWALCDGRNNTPDLTNRFIIGAHTSKIPSIEVINDGKTIQHVGNGIDPNLIKDSNKIIETGSISLMTGQIPFTLGHKYNDSTMISNIDTKRISSLGSDHGTNWFKQYIYNLEKRNATCNETEYQETYQKYYRDQISDTDLCTGFRKVEGLKNKDGQPIPSLIVRDYKYILNDYTMMRPDKQITISNGKPTKPDFKFYYDANSQSNELFPKAYIPNDLIGEAPIEVINTGETIPDVKHVPVKRRLFRDYEDYKILLEEGKRLGVSCYNCLPMNHKFTNHNYKFGNGTQDYIKEDIIQKLNNNIHLIPYKGNITLKEYMSEIAYEKPYSNNPSFFKLAYIIRVK